MEAAAPEYVQHKDNRDLSHIPGSYGLPLLGNTFGFITAPFDSLDQAYRQYGPVFKSSLTFQRMVVALGPEFIQQLMLDSKQEFSARMGYDAPLGDFFAGGLLMRDFQEHKFHRRIMQTAFKIDAMRTYVDLMQPIISQQLASWNTPGDFTFYPNVKTLLLDVGAKVFLGMDLDGPETDALNQAFLDMNEGTVALIRRDWPGLTYHKAMNGRRKLEEFFFNLTPERRGKDGKDMATFFANETTEDGDYFSEKVVGEHLIFLLLAAHDTTTSALTMAAYYLANDQAWQERLREETASLGRAELEYDDLGKNVPNLDHAFKEVLRMNPPVPMLMRRTVKPVQLGDFELEPHTMIQVSPLYTHRMAEYWTNPHVFDPDRFAREEHKQHPFLWAPFGGGAHKCIGLHFADMLFKCTLAQLLSTYRIRFAKEGQFPSKIQNFPFAKPMDDLPLVLEKL
ncbi:cytochrome P450 [Halioglobus pacificus]|uniref:Cytochrome P450 n=1 Tax=Parahalioglobus pacificus TaxID=930806 RepID=A0A919CJ27_9GAMM|nr:cytochrome P450 [Halioglobus pacificus]GHD27481.1 cytochrome P450 [Halioglobus pacificus]